MSQLHQLPNGDYIDPALVTGIVYAEADDVQQHPFGPKIKIPDRVVLFCTNRQTGMTEKMAVVFDTADEAKSWRTEFAEVVNEARATDWS